MADDENPTPAEGDPTETTPAARPQSAASRARRIGGGAAASRPAPNPARPSDHEPAAETVEPAASVAPAAPDDHAEAVDLGKSGAASGDKPVRRRRALPGWAIWTPAIAFAAAAVVFLALFLVNRVGGGDDAPGQDQATRAKVLAAAKTCLATLNTYRYDQLAQYRAAGTKCTTGRLTSDFTQAAVSLIGKNAPVLQSVQQAKITTAGIESVTSDGKQWTVLAYGTLAITTKTQKQGRNDPFAVTARLQQVGGRWLLVKIDQVSSATS